MTEPVFYYDFSSPYSYLAAHRVDEVLPVMPRWQPILFGALIEAIGKVPWSLRPGPARDAQIRECEERAAAAGLALRWPREWPLGTYSVLAARMALAAAERGRARELSLAAFRRGLGEGRDLTDPEVMAAAAREAGFDPVALAADAQSAHIKERLRAATDEALTRGVTGIPTVSVGGELFWGEDRLDDAARALGGEA